MKQRLGVVLGMVAAVLAVTLGLAGPASAASDATISATALEKSVKKAQKKAKATCKKAKKVSKSKSASKKAKKKAKKNCAKAKKNSKRLTNKLKTFNAQFFDVCKHGCKYKTIQAGANAAGVWQKKNPKRDATVRVQPGTYVEGVLLRGKLEGRDYNNLTIMGVKKDKTSNPNAEAVILEGKNAQTIYKGNSPTWTPQDPTTKPANNAIDAEDIDGLVLKNMWGRNYLNNTFFIWASNVEADNSHCSDFVMDNLISSDTRSYGLFSRNCFGGKFLNSSGWNHGDSALYIGETPCDDPNWNNRGDGTIPCQKNPDWTIVDNFTSHQNVLGYSGTNSKYVKIQNSTFYNNGAGIVPNSLDTEKFGPSGWMILENNDIFWNNYNYYQGLANGSEFETVSNGLGEIIPGVQVNYPTGIGIVLYGSDGIISRNNNIFGHEKWGAMAFSGPLGANKYDDAKNLNNQFIDNKLGRDGLDPNAVDFLDDATGGGNCYQNNGPNPTYVLGNGSVPADTIYPKSCPQPVKLNKDTSSLNLVAGIQADAELEGDDPNTVLGYAAATPPASMECSWTKTTHPPFTDADGVTYIEKRANPYTNCP
ncbi:MAG TPA: hypothetical protein VMF31_04600 [Solirubrobacterales bacterium]|nr:hypothetical protein [Solirubrobacterales bacterium]